MGCVSSTLLNQDDEFSHIGGNGLGHHIVSLTSTTYGLLTLDPPPPQESPTTATPPAQRFTLGSLFPSPLSEPKSIRSDPPEIINSWELMAGLDLSNDSFRFSPLPSKPSPFKENYSPNLIPWIKPSSSSSPNPKPSSISSSPSPSSYLDGFENLCPPRGESRVVVYTTTLRGVRKTFEDCNAVRAAIEGMGVCVCERDLSMDKGFREELRELMKGKGIEEFVPPRVFVRGKYVGGAEEVMRVLEEGNLGKLLEGLPRLKAGHVCEGCGGVRFLPCFGCNGSCKLAVMAKDEGVEMKEGRMTVVRCSDCNENGLVLCPICS